MATGTSTADMVQGWLSSKGEASTPDQASGKEPIPKAGDVKVTDGDFTTTQESTSEGLLPDSGDTPPDSSDQEQASSEADGKTPGTKEVITVTDDKGRRKVEVDFNNKDQLKKFVQMAYGARKWQAERDSARQETSTVKQQLGDLKSNWDVLEGAYQRQGIEGVIDLLEGKQGAYKQWEKKVADKAKFFENASPEEVEAFRAKENADVTRRELDRIRKENEEFKKQVSQEKEEAGLRSLESRVHPVFDRYRFADKLGDSNDEHMFDEMLWNSALKRLEPYEEKGLQITPELIEREFRQVASAIRKRIGTQAEKKASRVLDQKKQEATENVQAKVKSGYKGGGSAVKEARDLIDSRNLTGLLSNWKKYGNLFNK